MTHQPLTGRVAVVTGASRGLGKAVAIALAAAGAAVCLAARSEPHLEESAQAVVGAGGRALVVPTDVRRWEDVEGLMRRTVAELGRLDIVVNNSGIAKVVPLAEMSSEQWREVLDVNLTGVFHGCRAAAPYLVAQRSGKVINLASVLGAVGLPGYTAYGASKGGVAALTRALGKIQVNAIAPGWFVTDMNQAAFSDPRIHDRLVRDVPARRTGRLEEIGPLAVYLASPASDFMTGQTLFLDGGHSAA